MKNTYFISDIHLSFKEDDFEKEKRRNLLEFLQFVETDPECAYLYLLGDIFDFWFEWYHVVPKYWFPILFQLRKLVDRGIEVTFITGNHDFHIGSYLEKEIGLKCFDESHEFEVGEKKFFVAHGDGYAKKDRGYRLLKRIIRNRLSIFLYKTFVPADLGMQMATWFSHSSRTLVNIDRTAWAEEYFQYARKKFKEKFDYVILGHIHLPLLKEEDEHFFLCCGDWMTRFTYGKYDGTSLTLNYWKNQNN